MFGGPDAEQRKVWQQMREGQRIAFEAETTVNRKEYGLHWNAALETGGFLVGDEVKIMIEIQAVGQ